MSYGVIIFCFLIDYSRQNIAVNPSEIPTMSPSKRDDEYLHIPSGLPTSIASENPTGQPTSIPTILVTSTNKKVEIGNMLH